jgi:hypothetical protein
MIRRSLPGLSTDEREAVGYRALICSFMYKDMRWLHSYWDAEAEVSHCIYEAEDEEQVREHALRAGIPCDEVRRVKLVPAPSYGAAGETPGVAAIESSP